MTRGHRYSKITSVKEDVIEDYLVKRIKGIGGRAIKFDPRNARGLPDRICFLPGGLVLLVELKRPGATPRKNQLAQLATFRKLGFQATWCDTKGKVDAIIDWIKQYQKDFKMRPAEQICIRRECGLRLSHVLKRKEDEWT